MSEPYENPAQEGPDRVEGEPSAANPDVAGAGLHAQPGAPDGAVDATAEQVGPVGSDPAEGTGG